MSYGQTHSELVLSIFTLTLDIHCRVDEETNPGTTRRMKQSPCMDNLQNWFEVSFILACSSIIDIVTHSPVQENKITWVTILATVAAVQVMCVGIAIYILQRVSKIRKIR